METHQELASLMSADSRLQEGPGPFSWGRDGQQTCLQKVCPGGGPPAAGAELQEAVRRLVASGRLRMS